MNDITDGIQLKDCPFCGGKAEIEDYYSVINTQVSIKCAQCSAAFYSVRFSGVATERIKELAERWNRRTECHALQATEEKLHGE